jgi:hypothetical protein
MTIRSRRLPDRRWGALLPLLLTMCLAAGCGSSGNSNTTSSKAAYCDSFTSLQKSVDNLKNTDIVKNGTSALEKNLNSIKTDAQHVADNAKSAFSSEADAVVKAVDSLSSTVKQASSSPSATTLAAIPAAITTAVDSVKSLADAITSSCK